MDYHITLCFVSINRQNKSHWTATSNKKPHENSEMSFEAFCSNWIVGQGKKRSLASITILSASFFFLLSPPKKVDQDTKAYYFHMECIKYHAHAGRSNRTIKRWRLLILDWNTYWMLPLLPTALIAERKKYVYISKDFSGHRDTEEIENRKQLMNCCDTIMSACRCESQSVCVWVELKSLKLPDLVFHCVEILFCIRIHSKCKV